jgi:ABC-2 type transport system permease protein
MTASAKSLRTFSLRRTIAILLKETIQLRRDRLTFAMFAVIPIVQLILFGFAINNDPKHLPTAVQIEEHSRFSRGLISAMRNSAYFQIVSWPSSPREASDLLARGEVSFVVTIPAGFAREVLRGDRPQLLVEADATDPAAASNAIAALGEIIARGVGGNIGPGFAASSTAQSPADMIIHRRYNPEGFTRYNIVPGLIGVVLTLTTILSTALSLTRESERGTMENLLATPARPAEIMLGKITPNIILGFGQVAIILLAARYVFGVPMIGSLWLLLAGLLLFIAANVNLGYLFSTLAHNQMQAMQLTFFFFLPSILLSGFMFPFRGMPVWAQWIGEILPITHLLRIARGILLKGNGLSDISGELWPLALFLAAVAALTLSRFRRTLD